MHSNSPFHLRSSFAANTDTKDETGQALSSFATLDHCIGNTPLVRLQRLVTGSQTTVLAKLEGDNPAGSVKDRAAFNMIYQAELRGDIKSGDTLIEATSGNTGIALAMVAAMRGYRMRLIMPASATQERKDAMAAYGAELIDAEGMEHARDLAQQMAANNQGYLINQFDNADNADAHYFSTGPELWQQTEGRITHFVSAMGTTGTISGTGRFLKEKNPEIQVIGLQPAEDAAIAGIRRWPAAYQPKIYNGAVVDETVDVSQADAEDYMRRLARQEGIFAGVSSGANCWAACQLALQDDMLNSPDAVIVFIVCDRGDRYLSTGLYQD